MAIELFRIDDRLIHGQVVVGWGQPLDLAFIVLVDDEVASSEWEQELYRMGVPPEMDVHFDTVEGAAEKLAVYQRDERRGALLTGDIADDGEADRAHGEHNAREPRRHSSPHAVARSGSATCFWRLTRSRRCARSPRAAST